MAKFLIQDIVPPEKRKHPRVGVKKAEPAHAARPHAAHAAHTSHATHPAHARPVHHTAKPHEAEHPIEAERVVMHEPEQIEEPAIDRYEQEIPTETPERPQSMILEHLYQDTHRAKELSTESATGSWPYNNQEAHENKAERKSPPNFPMDGNGAEWSKRWLPWIVVPTLIAIALFFLLNYFAGATVLIIPKHDMIPIPETQVFSASKSPTDGTLPFAVMKVTLDDSTEVAATGTKMVTAKAQGKIVVYNEQTIDQRLIKNTRFESSAGKIYRINDSIIVPKAVTTKAGKITPGTVSVAVYADEAGPSYNASPSDFTVPGFKNMPQFKKVYGRSSGAILGGASGTTKSVSDTDLRDAGDNLRVSLETKLRNKARGDVASSQISFDKGIVVELSDPKLSTDPSSSPDKAVLVESGTLYMIVFDRDALTKAIAKGLVPTYAGENIEMKNLDSLAITLPASSGTALWAADKIDFSLRGTPQLEWIVDEEKVKKDLEGVAKANFNSVMGGYTTIERAKASLRPFWKTTFPLDPNVITLKIVSSIPD